MTICAFLESCSAETLGHCIGRLRRRKRRAFSLGSATRPKRIGGGGPSAVPSRRADPRPARFPGPPPVPLASVRREAIEEAVAAGVSQVFLAAADRRMRGIPRGVADLTAPV